MSKVFVGIDFGTTNSVLAYQTETKLEVLQVGNNGRTLMKSVVAFNKEQPVVNPPETAVENIRYSVTNCKRCLGVDYSEEIARKGRIMFNTVVERRERDGKCVFRISRPKKTNPSELILDPEEVASYVIKQMMEKLKVRDIISSIDDLGGVSMGIPATFNYDQRLATKKAAELAGLANVQFITEPTAAVLDYCNSHPGINDEYITVYDFGGGTFDATLVHVHDNCYDVICTSGNEALGGSDLDAALVEFVMDFYSITYGKDLISLYDDTVLSLKQKKASIQLRRQCEEAKIALSSMDSIEVGTEYLKDLEIDPNDDDEEEDDYLTINNDQFNKLIQPFIEKTFECIDELFQEGEKLTQRNRREFKKMVLIGGSSRIRNLPQFIRDQYSWVEVIRDCNPDECVARGACLYAHSSHNIALKEKTEDGNITVKERSSVTLGVGIHGGRVHHLIKRGDIIPAKQPGRFTTTEDNQEYIVSAVYEGDSEFIKDCRSIHKFRFGPITRKPKGEADLFITYEIDCAGLLKVICAENDELGNWRQIGVQEVDLV